MTIVCENIKKFRKFRGLSQAELGEKIGRSKNVVSNWERGENEPDLDAIAAACKVLGVTPNQMFGWERHPEYDAFYKRMFVYEQKMKELEEKRKAIDSELASIRKMLSDQ